MGTTTGTRVLCTQYLLRVAITHPTSNVQRIALHTAMDEYIPLEYNRHKIALYANDMAARANTLEEIFEIYKALFHNASQS